MIVSTLLHFLYQYFVPLVERSGLPYPSLSFWVMRISSCAAVFCENIPKTVEFSVFAEQVLTAQILRGYVPDTHTLLFHNRPPEARLPLSSGKEVPQPFRTHRQEDRTLVMLLRISCVE